MGLFNRLRRKKKNTPNRPKNNTQPPKWTSWLKKKPRQNNGPKTKRVVNIGKDVVYTVPASNTRPKPATRKANAPPTALLDTSGSFQGVKNRPYTPGNMPKWYTNRYGKEPKLEKLHWEPRTPNTRSNRSTGGIYNQLSNQQLERLLSNRYRPESSKKPSNSYTNERAKAAAGRLQLFADDIFRQLRYEEYRPLSKRNNAKLEQLRKNYAKATSVARAAQAQVNALRDGKPWQEGPILFPARSLSTRSDKALRHIENRASKRRSLGPMVMVAKQPAVKSTVPFNEHNHRSRHMQAKAKYVELGTPNLWKLYRSLESNSQDPRFPKTARQEAQIMLPAIRDVITERENKHIHNKAVLQNMPTNRLDERLAGAEKGLYTYPGNLELQSNHKALVNELRARGGRYEAIANDAANSRVLRRKRSNNSRLKELVQRIEYNKKRGHRLTRAPSPSSRPLAELFKL